MYNDGILNGYKLLIKQVLLLAYKDLNNQSGKLRDDSIKFYDTEIFDDYINFLGAESFRREYKKKIDEIKEEEMIKNKVIEVKKIEKKEVEVKENKNEYSLFTKEDWIRPRVQIVWG